MTMVENVNAVRLRSDFSVDLIQRMGNDASVVFAARVSTNSDKFNLQQEMMNPESDGELPDRDKGLINFLMREKHGTPFEHNSMTFRIEAPIFVWREFHRHRIGFSYNEQSGRYTEMKGEFYIPTTMRPLIQEGKMGNYSFVPGTVMQMDSVYAEMNDVYGRAYDAYKRMLKAGIAKEVARMVLPVSLYSTCYVTCNARSLMSFLSLRNSAYAMHEIRMVAMALEACWADMMPVVYNAYVDNGRIAP